MFSTQEKIKRIKQAYELLEDLSYRFDKELNLNSCDCNPDYHSHNPEDYSRSPLNGYADGVFTTMGYPLGILEYWLDDLEQELSEKIKAEELSKLVKNAS